MNYTEIFEMRGGSYDKAMSNYPDARDDEFNLVVNILKNLDVEKILDLPSGGGYLKKYLPKQMNYCGFEPSTGFINNKVTDFDKYNVEKLPYDKDEFDALVSIAGVHHIKDKIELFNEWFRVLKKGGYIIVVDVDKDSTVASFLDDFVGSYNVTGHSGIYLTGNSEELLTSCGFKNVTSRIEKFSWNFKGLDDMCEFCRQLFSLENITDKEIIENTKKHLGFEKVEGFIRMNWELRVLLGIK